MKVNEIIRARRKELGLTLKQVADKLGVSESLISRYESNDVKNMGIDKLIPLAKVLKTTPAYLMGWEEDKTSSNELSYDMIAEPTAPYNISNKKITYEKLIPLEIVEIPMYGKASAGNGYINLEQEIGSYTIPKHIYKKGIFAIRVSGDSMTGIDKSIPDGSTAIVDPELCSDPINLNNKVCVFEYDDETYIKQLIIDKQGIIRLRSFNSEYDDIIVLNEKLLLCKGRVIRTFVENQW
jgi:putative prophage lambdaCh01, repressor protein|nr:MAG TPA: Repressor protein CI [Caudoviricetes sp.]